MIYEKHPSLTKFLNPSTGNAIRESEGKKITPGQKLKLAINLC